MANNAQIIVDFVANLTGLTRAAGDVEKTGKNASKGLDWKGIAKWTAAAGGIATAAGFLVTATKNTEGLAKSTLALQRATGMDTKTASEWVLLTQQRGISSDQLGKSMVTLSKNMEAWRKAGAGADSPLKQLGVSFEDVRKGNVGAVLSQISDGLAKIKNPAERAALAAKLFGRGGQALVPILGKGSTELGKALEATNKYGAALTGPTLKAVQDQIKAQRELDDAHKGLSTTIGSAVLPVQAQLYGALAGLLGIVVPLLQSYDLMGPAVIAVATAYAAYKAAALLAAVANSKDLIVTIAQVTWKGAQAVATYAVAAAQWVLNAAMAAGLGPVLLVVAGIAALVAVGILVWKNWDSISAGMSAAFARIKSAAVTVWNWIKANWPMLLAILTGPLGIAVATIIGHWGSIKSAFNSGVAVAKSALTSLKNWLGGPIGTITGYLDDVKSAMDAPGAAMTAAVAAIKAAINDLVHWLERKVSSVTTAAGKVADALKGPINAVIGAWNGIAFHVPKFTIGGQKVGPISVPKATFGGETINFPDIGKLAKGGVIDRPTIALVGEAGREIVTPEKLLRELLAEQSGRGDQYTLVMQPRTADAADVAYAFRRLELLRTGR